MRLHGLFSIVKRFYTDFTFPLFLILHSDFTMQLWLRDGEHRNSVTVQYPHSYGQKSIEKCLLQWDFCLQAHVFIRSAQ